MIKALAHLAMVAAALALGACRPRVMYPDVKSAVPEAPVVQLRRADVVFPVGEHYFFVYWDPDRGRWIRNELLASGRRHKRMIIEDRYGLDSAFAARGLRRARIVAEFRGRRAERLLTVLRASVEDYPRQDRYVLMGPNSNTYVAQILRDARVGHDFTTRAIGRRFPSRIGLSDSRTGVALHTPILGVELGLLDGIELNLGPATFGIDLVPPAIRTPVGRIGAPQPSIPLGPRPQEYRASLVAAGARALHLRGITYEDLVARHGEREARRILRFLALRVLDPPHRPK